MNENRSWTIKDSSALYNVPGWSNGYFRINTAGNVEVTPSGPEGPSIDLHALIQDVIKTPNDIERITYLIWACHNLERIADRVTNICERVIFMVTGQLEEINVSRY